MVHCMSGTLSFFDIYNKLDFIFLVNSGVDWLPSSTSLRLTEQITRKILLGFLSYNLLRSRFG